MLLDELGYERLLAGHGLGAHDIRPTDAGTVLRWQLLLLPRALGAEQEGKPSDLRGAEIDIDAVEIVLDDEAGNVGEEGTLLGILNDERREGREGRGRLPCFVTAVRDFPGFVVDDFEQIEGV